MPTTPLSAPGASGGGRRGRLAPPWNQLAGRDVIMSYVSEAAETLISSASQQHKQYRVAIWITEQPDSEAEAVSNRNWGIRLSRLGRQSIRSHKSSFDATGKLASWWAIR